MKIAPLILLAALCGYPASAADTRAPQPRIKLDPAIRESLASTVSETRDEEPAAAVVMDRFVVKGIAALPFVQRKEPVLRHGKFKPWTGGSFLDRNFGKSNVFIGIKPWFDIMEEDARFKHPAAPRINFTLLQLGR